VVVLNAQHPSLSLKLKHLNLRPRSAVQHAKPRSQLLRNQANLQAERQDDLQRLPRKLWKSPHPSVASLLAPRPPNLRNQSLLPSLVVELPRRRHQNLLSRPRLRLNQRSPRLVVGPQRERLGRASFQAQRLLKLPPRSEDEEQPKPQPPRSRVLLLQA